MFPESRETTAKSEPNPDDKLEGFVEYARLIGPKREEGMTGRMPNELEAQSSDFAFLVEFTMPDSRECNSALLAQVMARYVIDDASFWRERMKLFLMPYLSTLIWMRDELGIPVTRDTAERAASFGSLIGLLSGTTFGFRDEEGILLPAHIRSMIRGYLGSLPGFMESKGVHQTDTTLIQHGYIEMCMHRFLKKLTWNAAVLHDADISMRMSA